MKEAFSKIFCGKTISFVHTSCLGLADWSGWKVLIKKKWKCNCFYEREARARVPAQACYCRSLCHSDVADCWSCLCMFQSGLQHHAESRDHPMYSLSRSLWGWHPKMKIRHQNGRALPHQAETQGLTMLLKTWPFLFNFSSLSWGAHLRWCLYQH